MPRIRGMELVVVRRAGTPELRFRLGVLAKLVASCWNFTPVDVCAGYLTVSEPLVAPAPVRIDRFVKLLVGQPRARRELVQNRLLKPVNQTQTRHICHLSRDYATCVTVTCNSNLIGERANYSLIFPTLWPASPLSPATPAKTRNMSPLPSGNRRSRGPATRFLPLASSV